MIPTSAISKNNRAVDMLRASVERRAKKYGIKDSELPFCNTKDELLALIGLIEEEGGNRTQKTSDSIVDEVLTVMQSDQPITPTIIDRAENEDKPISIYSLYPESAETRFDGNAAYSLEWVQEPPPLQIVSETINHEPCENAEPLKLVKSDGMESACAMEWYIFREVMTNPRLMPKREQPAKSTTASKSGTDAPNEESTNTAADVSPLIALAEANQHNVTKEQQHKDNAAQVPIDSVEEVEAEIDEKELERRKEEAYKTSKIFTGIYAKHVPRFFKHLAKFDNTKLDQMHYKGEIDLDSKVMADKTFRQFRSDHNANVDKLFDVSEDQVQAITEPLADMMAEKGWFMSPTGRLILSVLNHLGDQLTMAIQMRKTNNRMLEAFMFRTSQQARGSPGN